MEKTPVLVIFFITVLVALPASVSATSSSGISELGNSLPIRGFAAPLQRSAPKPDLTVFEIVLTPSAPVEGELVVISVTIKNLGFIAAFNVKTRVYDGDPMSGKIIGSANIAQIKSGKSAIARFSWSAESGSHSIYVVADPDGVILETNESNNSAYKTVNVAPATGNQLPIAMAGPDVMVTDVDGNGAELVTLDGSASYDPDGYVVSYVWREGESTLGTGAIIKINFAVSSLSHTVILTVRDDDGSEATDTCVITVTAVSEGDKWAVIIGISDYQGTNNDLWNPDKDASDMYGVLTTTYGFPSTHILMLRNQEATMASILDAINWLNGMEDSPSDIVVFFFSGHGYRTSESSWGNSDGDSESDRQDEFIVSYDLFAYADGFLAQQFATFDSDNLFLWFGSCFSGGMYDIGKATGFSGLICMACKETQYGWDVSSFGNTLFGEYFIDRGLRQHLADSNMDGIVTMEEAFTYAAPLVSNWAYQNTQSRSEPQIFDSNPSQDFRL